MTTARIALIRERLESELAPAELEIRDDSHLHRGHAAARDGRGHFSVYVVSQTFDGLNRIQRHRLIYAAMDTLMQTDIHALAITALTPSEAKGRRK
jgi:BolA family transcriptional regulator, general stress-responsive regulator